MQRWHEASCSNPDIEILSDQSPRCRSCDGAPGLAELVRNLNTASSVPIVPSDKPLGHLDLWWPASVTYSKSKSFSHDLGSKAEAQASQEHSQQIGSPSIYSSTLGQNEFRLACLAEVGSHESPLHLTLETYDIEDCPEYETVSYTWAGEDGDNRLCRPIYVGQFWDVLLQTKNCWEMLRFLRPWRGIRMIWVDAVCINQGNLYERNNQVAIMGRIYSSCSRAIVYLGPDLAVPLHGRHPRRRRLHELESGSVTPLFSLQPGEDKGNPQPDNPPHTLNDLLGRRYFSRIWVIQELLLSQRVVIRVGDVDFWADPAMSSHFSSSVPGWDWGQSRAAWMQHVSQGAASVKDLKQLLWITSLSQATDARDRVFGLLGILPELSVLRRDSSPAPQGGFYADYSLSCQHVFIGLFAYCLINMRQPNILYHASCVNSKLSNYPSWVPDWTSRTTWRLLFTSPKHNSNEVFKQLQALVEQAHPYDRQPFQLQEVRGPAQPHVSSERSWHQGAHINPSSGALVLNLTHFMAISKRPERIGNIGGFHVFETIAEPFGAYFLSEHRLDTIITGSGNERLFILDAEGRSPIYLILRPTAGIYDKTFKLVSICPHVLIRTPWSKSNNEIPMLRVLSLQDIQNSLYNVLMEAQQEFDQAMIGIYEDSALFPGIKTYREVFTALLTLHAESNEGVETVTDDFANAYQSCINPEYAPGVQEGYLVATISNRSEDWDKFVYKTSWLSLDRHESWEYRTLVKQYWSDAPLSSSEYKKLTKLGGMEWIDVRFKLSQVRTALYKSSKLSGLFDTLGRLRHTSKETGEDVRSMLTRKPRAEDMFVGCSSYKYTVDFNHYALWDRLDVVGSTFLVTIE